jgi:hypothetical protein
MPWHVEEQERIAENVGMDLEEMRNYLGFSKNADGSWMPGFPINDKPCGFRDPDPNEDGKFLCRCYQVQAINCGKFPDCALTSSPEGLARAASRCPGITVLNEEALALVPRLREEWLVWKARKPYKPSAWRRLRRRVLSALGVQP